MKSIYLNHYPELTSPKQEAVTAELSDHDAAFTGLNTPLGYVVKYTFKHLGVEVAASTDGSDMLLLGSQTEVETRRSRLASHIGAILRGADEVKNTSIVPSRDAYERSLHMIADEDRMRPRTFIRTAGDILATLNDAHGDEACRVVYGAGPDSAQWVLDLREKILSIGKDRVSSLIQLLPEARVSSAKRTTRDQLVLLRGADWVIRTDPDAGSYSEAKRVKDLHEAMSWTRRAIDAVMYDMHARGLPEPFHLPLEVWNGLIDDKLEQGQENDRP